MASKAWRAGKHDQIIVRARAFIIAYPLLRNRSPLAFLPSARARFASKKDAKEIKLIPFTDETTTTAFRITRIGVNIEVNIWKRVNRRFHVSRNWNFIRSNAIRWDSCTLYCSIYLLWNFFFFFFQASLPSREIERSSFIKILTIERVRCFYPWFEQERRSK